MLPLSSGTGLQSRLQLMPYLLQLSGTERPGGRQLGISQQGHGVLLQQGDPITHQAQGRLCARLSHARQLGAILVAQQL